MDWLQEFLRMQESSSAVGGAPDLGVMSRRITPRPTEEENAALLAWYGEQLNTREQRFWDEQRLRGERARDPAQRALSLGPAALEILANLTNVQRGINTHQTLSESFGANIAGARRVMDEYAEGVGPDGDPFGSYRRYAEEINAPYPEFSSVLMDFLEPTGTVAKGTAAAVKALGSLGEALPALGFVAPGLVQRLQRRGIQSGNPEMGQLGNRLEEFATSRFKEQPGISADDVFEEGLFRFNDAMPEGKIIRDWDNAYSIIDGGKEVDLRSNSFSLSIGKLRPNTWHVHHIMSNASMSDPRFIEYVNGITRLADAAGVTLTTHPQAFGHARVSTEGLKKLYAKMGFELSGYYGMVRAPMPLEESARVAEFNTRFEKFTELNNARLARQKAKRIADEESARLSVGVEHVASDHTNVRNQRLNEALESLEQAITETAFVERTPLPEPPQTINFSGFNNLSNVSARRWDDIITRRAEDVSIVETWGGHYYQYVNPRTGEKIPLNNPPMRVDELPEEMYHVTTNTPAVNASGRLEVSHGADRGLGGTSGQDSVSFTISREIAESIETDLRTFASLKYFRTFDEVIDFFDALVRREGASPAQIEEFIGRWRKKAPEWARELETEGLKYFDDDIPYNDAVGFAKNMFKEYSFYRSYWGAPPSSIIIGDPRSPYWRSVQPEDISIITVPRGAIPDEALIRNYDVGRNGLEEIQVYADVRFGDGR